MYYGYVYCIERVSDTYLIPDTSGRAIRLTVHASREQKRSHMH
jgi:hypothetical protein